MGWCLGEGNKYGILNDNDNKIHVVTHSNAMQYYLKKYFNYIPALNIVHTNSWRFTTRNNNSITDLLQVKSGVLNDKDKNIKSKAVQIEQNAGTNSLCAYDPTRVITRFIPKVMNFGKTMKNNFGRPSTGYTKVAPTGGKKTKKRRKIKN